MTDANLKQVADFFKTGDPERDRLASFSAEWKRLTEESKNEIKALVGAALGLNKKISPTAKEE